NRRGIVTAYSWGTRHVADVRSHMSEHITQPPWFDGDITFQHWDDFGMMLGSPSGAVSAGRLANTVIDGPRSDAWDVAEYAVDKWGAPAIAIGPDRDSTRVLREDPAFPALVTREVLPNGHTRIASYDQRGNLAVLADSAYTGTNARDTTRYDWD